MVDSLNALSKKCPDCRSDMDSKAIVCPSCGKTLGSFVTHLFVWIRTHLLSIILASVVTWLVTTLAASYFMPVLPFPQLPRNQVLSKRQGNLFYKFVMLEGKIPRGLFGIKFGPSVEISAAIVEVGNGGRHKLNNVRISLSFSKKLALHDLPDEYELYDLKGNRITDFEKEFAHSKSANILIPHLLPEQKVSMTFFSSGKLKLYNMSVYSDEVVGIEGLFSKNQVDHWQKCMQLKAVVE